MCRRAVHRAACLSWEGAPTGLRADSRARVEPAERRGRTPGLSRCTRRYPGQATDFPLKRQAVPSRHLRSIFMASHQSPTRRPGVSRRVWLASALAVSLAAAGVAGVQVSRAATIDPSTPTSKLAASTCADRTYSAMTTAQRVGQLFMGGVTPSAPDSRRIALMQQYHVGSVFLAGRSKAGTAATKSVVDGLQVKADTVAGHRVGLLVSTDQEGGQVQVLSGPGFSTIPSALTQGTWTTTQLRSASAGWAKELKSAGVNLNLAPVADVVPASLGTGNPPIGKFNREFGHTAAVVAPHSDAFLEGSLQSGVLATLKHFPGLGY